MNLAPSLARGDSSRRSSAPKAPHTAGATFLAAGLGLLVSACSDAFAPDRLRSTIRFDVSALTAALGDGASVAARAELVVSRGQVVVRTAQQPLAPSDSMASFAIELDAGSYDFRASVYSNNDALLYDGTTPQMIARDGFLVEIVPQAVNAVMVVSPRSSTARRPPPTGGLSSARIAIRNAGSTALSWRVDCVRRLPSAICTPGQNVADPFAGTVRARLADTTIVAFVDSGSYEVRFQSNVGSVSAAVAVEIGVIVPTPNGRAPNPAGGLVWQRIPTAVRVSHRRHHGQATAGQ